MSKYKYNKVYNSIKEDIKNTHELGDILEYDRDLASKYNVSLITIKSAMSMLVEEGTLSRKSGQRTRVISIPEDPIYFSLIMCSYNSAFGSVIVERFERLCQENGYIPLISRSFDQSDMEGKIIKQHLAMGTSGIIIQSVDEFYVNKDLNALFNKKFPLVAIDRPLQNIAACLVTSQNKDNTKKLIDYMTLTNRKNILLVAPQYTFSSSSNNQRLVDIMTNAQARKLEYYTIFTSITNYEEQTQSWNIEYNDLKSNIIKHSSLQNLVILCINYDIAKEVVAIIERLQLTHIEVTCFDYPNNLNKVYMTHILQNETSLINHSFNNLILQYKGEVPDNRTEIPSSFIVHDDKVK